MSFIERLVVLVEDVRGTFSTWVVLPAIIALVGFILFVNIKSDYDTFVCRTYVTAMVTEIHTAEERSSEDGYSDFYIVCYPVLSYDVDGVTYRYLSPLDTHEEFHKVGDMVALMYEEKNPGHCILASVATSSPIWVIFLFVLFVFLVFYWFYETGILYYIPGIGRLFN